MKIYLREMRIKSWLKNLFVFSPIIFSLELFEWNKLLKAGVLTLAFCLISSAIYVLNDISDVETKSEGDGLYKQVRIIYKGLR